MSATDRGPVWRATIAVVAIASVSLAVVPTASGSEVRKRPVTVVAGGFDGPFGIAAGPKGIAVADSVAGTVSLVTRHGARKVVIRGVPGVAGVAQGPKRVFAVIGGPDETGEDPPGDYKPTSLLATRPHSRKVTVLANLLRYELKQNPDGQVQFVDGQPVDALSNPFSMTMSRRGLLVADGGANDVLRVNRVTGKVSTFFVPPTVTDVPACLEDGAQANPGTVGCDPVPTGVTVRGRSVYISTLGAEVPGAGRVYKVGLRSGKVQRVWKRLTAPTGVSVGRHHTVYVSEVLFGAPQGPPGPDFDPSQIGRLTRIAGCHRTHAQVTMPTGLDYRHGRLYSSAWSIASFLGIEGAGQVVRVRNRAFH